MNPAEETDASAQTQDQHQDSLSSERDLARADEEFRVAVHNIGIMADNFRTFLLSRK